MNFRKFKFFPLIIVGLFIFGLLVMLLWNWLIPAIFNGPEVTYWQAIGLFILAKILTGFPHKGGHHRCHHHGRREMWRRKFASKWAGMSPEEKARFKDCCHWEGDPVEETTVNSEGNKED